MLTHARTMVLLAGCIVCGCAPVSLPPSTAVRESTTAATVGAESAADESAPFGQTPVPTAADIDAVGRIPAADREQLALFAEATFQLQRINVLQEAKIHDELKLTAPQIAEFAKVSRDVKDTSAKLQRASGAELGQFMEREVQPKLVTYRELVEATLDDAQEHRLWQRVLQRQRGAIVFLAPGVPERLRLTAEQQASLYQIADTTRKSVNFDNLSSPLELGRIVVRANAARKEAEALLTDAQRAEWERVLGQ